MAADAETGVALALGDAAEVETTEDATAEDSDETKA